MNDGCFQMFFEGFGTLKVDIKGCNRNAAAIVIAEAVNAETNLPITAIALGGDISLGHCLSEHVTQEGLFTPQNIIYDMHFDYLGKMLAKPNCTKSKLRGYNGYRRDNGKFYLVNGKEHCSKCQQEISEEFLGFGALQFTRIGRYK